MQVSSPLHRAAQQGHSHYLRPLVIEQGMWTNTPDPITGDTPLHVAATFGDRDAVKQLLRLGALIKAKNNRGYTALHIASGKGYTDVVDELLAHGAIPNRKSKQGKRPLHLAAFFGRKPIIWRLLMSGANPNARDYTGKTPVHIAATNNFPDTVQLLVQHSGNPFLPAHDQSHPINISSPAVRNFFHSLVTLSDRLQGAILKQKHKEIGSLLAQGAPINGQDDKKGNTPLHIAAMINSFPTMYTLLIHGADPTITNEEGYTPVHLALTQPFAHPDYTPTPEEQLARNDQFLRTIRFFIKATTLTPKQLWRAVRSNERRKVETLLTQAAETLPPWSIRNDVEPQPIVNTLAVSDPSGNTLLHMSATGHSPALTQLLLDYGLNPRKTNNAGLSAIDYAQTHLSHIEDDHTRSAYQKISNASSILHKLSDEQYIGETACKPASDKENSREPEKEKENCCICQDELTRDSRIFLSPCGCSNFCRDCARGNFFPAESWERGYSYRQVCPLCRTQVDLTNLEERLFF